jgi:hypothetical protein
MGDTFHFTQTVFLGVDDEASKEALWALFDALAFKLMLRTQVQGGLQGDEGEDCNGPQNLDTKMAFS